MQSSYICIMFIAYVNLIILMSMSKNFKEDMVTTHEDQLFCII